MQLILVPGLWLDADSWQDVVPMLADAGHEIRIVPSPGLGSSGDRVAEIGMAAWVAAIVGEIDSTGAPVALVGHSGGGNAAWGAAAARPDLVARVILVDTTAPPPGVGVSEFDAVGGVVPFPGWDFFDDADVADLDPETRARWAPRTASVPAGVPSDPIAITDERRFDIPVTMLMGSLDRSGVEAVMAQWGPWQREYETLRDVEVVTLDSGHWPQFSAPDRLAAAITAAVADR